LTDNGLSRNQNIFF